MALMALVGVALVLVVVVVIMAQDKRDLTKVHEGELAKAEAEAGIAAQPIITEQSIAGLPAPVQRYVRKSGALGKPRPSCVHVAFDAEMIQKPGAPGMRGPAEQVDCFARPKRLFFMKTRMYGLPVAVLHNYEGTEASMIVRIASLFTIIDVKGQEAARTETVTILNDLCLFAPGWLTDERLAWTPVDDRQASVTFTNGPYTVTAMLHFNEVGDLINFTSQDRGALQDDGSLRILPWSTPIRDHREFNGLRLPAGGDAVWHYPEGDFIYGRFKTRAVR